MTLLPDQAVKVDSQKGFYRTDAFKDSNALRQAISYGNECVSAHLENQDRKNHKKNYLQNIEFESSFENPLVRLALNKDLVSIASEHLGFVPILSNANLWYSPNDGRIQKGSQMFHLDWADIRQCKLFIPLKEIDDDTGTDYFFFSASESSKVANAVNYRLSNESNRLEDELVYSIADKSQVEKAVGKPGDIFFCDSCRCFHYGSRKALKTQVSFDDTISISISFTHPIFYKGKSKFSHFGLAGCVGI